MKKYIILMLILLIALFVGSIWFFKVSNEAKNSDTTQRKVQSINSPMASMDPAFQTYSIENEKDVDIVRNTGTRIRFSKESFVNKKGEPVNGKIDLKLREFHSPENIMQAGVPMRLNAETDQFLQSAGMIELRAFVGDEELELKKDKSISVDLAAYRPSDGYQLYYLENNDSWKTIDSFSNNQNKRKEDKLKEWAAWQKNISDSTQVSDDFVFDISGNYTEAPDLIPLAGRKWKLCKGYNREEAQKAMRINWSNVRVTKVDGNKDVYEMVFSMQQQSSDPSKDLFRSMVFKATPMIDTKEGTQDQELFQAQMRQYEARYAKMAEEMERVKGEADMLSSFSIRKMGVYNIDKICDEGEMLMAAASFDFEKELDEKINRVRLFAVYVDQNSVVEYPKEKWASIRFAKNRKMNLVAYLPDQKLAVVNDEMIKEVFKQGNSVVKLKTLRYDPKQYFAQMNMSYAAR